jgi:ATP synthase protein I
VRNSSKQKALKAVFIQFLAVILLSVVALCVGRIYCISVLLGGLAAVTPNLLFAIGLFGKLHQKRPEQLLARFYVGAFVKIVLSVTAIMWVVMTMQVSMLALLLSFLVTMLVFSVVGAKQ